MKSPASRKSAERQRRKDAGEVRVEVYLDADTMADLSAIMRYREDSREDAIKAAIYQCRCLIP